MPACQFCTLDKIHTEHGGKEMMVCRGKHKGRDGHAADSSSSLTRETSSDLTGDCQLVPDYVDQHTQTTVIRLDSVNLVIQTLIYSTS